MRLTYRDGRWEYHGPAGHNVMDDVITAADLRWLLPAVAAEDGPAAEVLVESEWPTEAEQAEAKAILEWWRDLPHADKEALIQAWLRTPTT